MAETEKITINMNVVDLGKVDLLVEQGFYSNRTDFIKTSIKGQLAEHTKVIDKVLEQKNSHIGVARYTRDELEELRSENKQLTINHVGLLSFAKDVDKELVLATIHSIKISGVIKAPTEVKEVLETLKK